jgi:hypothetical protein
VSRTKQAAWLHLLKHIIRQKDSIWVGEYNSDFLSLKEGKIYHQNN